MRWGGLPPRTGTARLEDRIAPGRDAAGRFARVDALRGAAMLWMAAFHLAFDLNHFRWLTPVQNFYRDPLWTWQRVAIVSLFLFTAGVGQAIAQGRELPSARFWRRWAQIVGCAVLVSLGSWLMFPQSYITFGVLHAIAVMLLLLRWLGRFDAPVLLALVLVALVLPEVFQHAWFDSRWTNWMGLVTHKPRTEDYVPLLPWLGAMLLGFAAGRRAERLRPVWFTAPVPAWLRPLARLGQWPLTFYMVHQPVLIALVAALSWIAR